MRAFSPFDDVPRYTRTPSTLAGGAVHVRFADPFATIATVASFDPDVSPLVVRNVIFQKYVAAPNVPPLPTAPTASPDGGAIPPGSSFVCVLVT